MTQTIWLPQSPPILIMEPIKQQLCDLPTAVNPCRTIIHWFPLLDLCTEFAMMTSSKGYIFRLTGSLHGEFTGHRWIPLTRPMTQNFDVFFDLCLNKQLSKHSGPGKFWTTLAVPPRETHNSGYCPNGPPSTQLPFVCIKLFDFVTFFPIFYLSHITWLCEFVLWICLTSLHINSNRMFELQLR